MPYMLGLAGVIPNPTPCHPTNNTWTIVKNMHYKRRRHGLCDQYRNMSWVSLIQLNFGFILLNVTTNILPLHWRHNDHDGASNHQPHSCLLNRLFRRRSKKTSKLRVTGLCVGNSPGPVNFPHKGSVTLKMFPFDDVIMDKTYSTSQRFLIWQSLVQVDSPVSFEVTWCWVNHPTDSVA